LDRILESKQKVMLKPNDYTFTGSIVKIM